MKLGGGGWRVYWNHCVHLSVFPCSHACIHVSGFCLHNRGEEREAGRGRERERKGEREGGRERKREKRGVRERERKGEREGERERECIPFFSCKGDSFRR